MDNDRFVNRLGKPEGPSLDNTTVWDLAQFAPAKAFVAVELRPLFRAGWRDRRTVQSMGRDVLVAVQDSGANVELLPTEERWDAIQGRVRQLARRHQAAVGELHAYFTDRMTSTMVRSRVVVASRARNHKLAEGGILRGVRNPEWAPSIANLCAVWATEAKTTGPGKRRTMKLARSWGAASLEATTESATRSPRRIRLRRRLRVATPTEATTLTLAGSALSAAMVPAIAAAFTLVAGNVHTETQEMGFQYLSAAVWAAWGMLAAYSIAAFRNLSLYRSGLTSERSALTAIASSLVLLTPIVLARGRLPVVDLAVMLSGWTVSTMSGYLMLRRPARRPRLPTATTFLNQLAEDVDSTKSEVETIAEDGIAALDISEGFRGQRPPGR